MRVARFPLLSAFLMPFPSQPAKATNRTFSQAIHNRKVSRLLLEVDTQIVLTASELRCGTECTLLASFWSGQLTMGLPAIVVVFSSSLLLLLKLALLLSRKLLLVILFVFFDDISECVGLLFLVSIEPLQQFSLLCSGGAGFLRSFHPLSSGNLHAAIARRVPSFGAHRLRELAVVSDK